MATLHERIERLRRLQASTGMKVGMTAHLSALDHHAYTLDAFNILLDAVVAGTAMQDSWQNYDSLRLMREAIDRYITALEAGVVHALPAGETAQ